MPTDHRRGLAEVFRMPALVGLASAAGLVTALLGDGPWDALSWLALGWAVGLALWHGLRRRYARGIPLQPEEADRP